MKELLSVRMVENDKGEIDLLIDPDEATGEHVDLLLRALSSARQQMQPPVLKEMPKQMSQIEVVPTPGWFLGGTFEQGLVLCWRHPSFGWLGFQVSDQIRKDLMQGLEAAPSSLPPATAH